MTPNLEESDEESPRIRIPRADLVVALAIALTTFAAYAPAVRFGFIWLDDGKYVYDNPHLRAALTPQTFKWVFLSLDPDNWFPLTRLSLLLDYKLFGLRAGVYHAENIVVHIMAALLLYGFLRQATRVRWPSAFAAFVFALHPLHVESVAWVAERKDVLCALFWFATLWAWALYAQRTGRTCPSCAIGKTERPGLGRYLAALALFSLGLMSKPMIVTLPLLLLLLDVWPFRRALSSKLIVEKIPFIALSCAVMAITVAAQRGAGTIQPLNTFSVPLRVENALVTLWIYIGDTLWPARLWAARAYARDVPALEAIGAAIGVIAVCAMVLRQWRDRPYLAVGWFWFLGTLAPVIGLLQVGLQARADRYMYVPMVGLIIALAWGAGDAVRQWTGLRQLVPALAVAACLAMAIKTSFQVRYWKDPEALFRHAIEMDNQNYLAWNYLGGSILSLHPERALEAVSCYRSALKIRPETATLHSNLALALCQAGRCEEGVAEFREALRINPDSGETHSHLAAALLKTGRRNEAVGELETALRFNPRLADAHVGLASILVRVPGMEEAAIAHLRAAQHLQPSAELQEAIDKLERDHSVTPR